MSLFIVGVLALLLVAAALLFLGARVRLRSADADDPNLLWLRQRRAELADSDNAELLDDLGLRLIEERGNAGDGAAADATVPEAAARDGRRLALLAVLALAAFALPLYWQLGALEDLRIYRQLERLPDADDTDGTALADLTAAVRARSARRPDNLNYLDLLGQLQLSANDLPAAAASFKRLAEAAPESARAQAQAAQLLFLAAERRLTQEAQLLAERALALDPREGTALGLLGMAAFEGGQYSAAAQYWERLQALEVPDSEGYRMLDGVIAMARERAGNPAGATAQVAQSQVAQAPAGGSPSAGSGISVSLALPEGLAVDPAATVFVFARAAAATSRMPIAVRRLTAAELPLTLQLSDADSMAGQRLSEAGEVVVSAQVSRNGQPGAGNAAYMGNSEPVAAASEAQPVHIELMPVAPR